MPRTRRAAFCRRPARCIALHLPAGEARAGRYRRAAGDAVTPFYDPMIAKIIARGEDRAAARCAAGPRPRRHRRARGRDQSRVSGACRRATRISPPARSIPALSSGGASALLAPAGPPPDTRPGRGGAHRLLSRERAPRPALRPTRGRGGTAGGSTSQRPPQRFLFRCGEMEHAVAAAAIGAGLAAGARGRACHELRGERRPDGGSPFRSTGCAGSVRVLDARGGTRWYFSTARAGVFDAIDPLAPPAGAARLPAG